MDIEAIKDELSDILEDLRGSDAATVAAAMTQYCGIVELFYREHESLMSPQQYRTAQQEPEYFLRLLELAEEYRKTRF